MIGYLMAFGILLIVVGIWGGPRRREKPDKTSRIPREATVQEAWEILISPVEYDEELIKIPEDRPWYLPGGDRRFWQGLLVGLGSGVLAMALLVRLAPGIVQQQAPPENPPGQVAVEPEPGNPEAPPEEPGEPEPQVPAGPEEPAEPEAPAGPEAPPAEITVVIEPGSLSWDIAAALKEAGLIADEQEFLDRVAELGVETSLQAGTFTFPSGVTIDEIIAALTA